MAAGGMATVLRGYAEGAVAPGLPQCHRERWPWRPANREWRCMRMQPTIRGWIVGAGGLELGRE